MPVEALAEGCAERRVSIFGIDGRKYLPGGVVGTDGVVAVADVKSGDAERRPGMTPSPSAVTVLGSASSSSSEAEPS